MFTGPGPTRLTGAAAGFSSWPRTFVWPLGCGRVSISPSQTRPSSPRAPNVTCMREIRGSVMTEKCTVSPPGRHRVSAAAAARQTTGSPLGRAIRSHARCRGSVAISTTGWRTSTGACGRFRRSCSRVASRALRWPQPRPKARRRHRRRTSRRRHRQSRRRHRIAAAAATAAAPAPSRPAPVRLPAVRPHPRGQQRAPARSPNCTRNSSRPFGNCLTPTSGCSRRRRTRPRHPHPRHHHRPCRSHTQPG